MWQSSHLGLHAGQLRYHDFSKLRELRRDRLLRNFHSSSSLSSLSSSFSSGLSSNRRFNVSFLSPSGGAGDAWLQQQRQQLPNSSADGRRSFVSLTDLANATRIPHVQLKSLEALANSRPSDTNAQFQFLTKLVENHQYQAVIDRVSDPAYREFALDSRCLLLYLQALQNSQTFNQFNLEDSVNRMLEQASPIAPALSEFLDEARRMPKSKQVSGLLSLLISNGAAAGAVGAAGTAGAFGSASAPALARGLDPNNPFFVQIAQQSSARATILALAGRVVLGLIMISAISAILDEKGVGKSLGIGGNSKHVQQAEVSTNVSFNDIKGVDEAKSELEEIVMYLKNPTKFTRLGGKLPRGLLLTGPPGTGKTLLAKAIAGEANVPFYFCSGSQFEEVYVGLGAKRIRELFEAAKNNTPCIIFIDEIDAVGGTRKLKDQSALKMTLNELLVQMDGFEENSGVIVIGATNFMESLDEALLRPGRFDKHITVPLPDVGGRKEILEMYAAKTKLHPDVDLNVIARGTTGFSGADLFNLMNQAALKASVDGLNNITMSVLEYAKDKLIMGAERKTAVISAETAKCTAYHEAGHALVAVLTEGAMPIHKATIMPRGRALGMVTMLPVGDQTSQSYKEMLAAMDVCMGGRVAEELIFGRTEATSGASSDIASATNIARNMVTRYGFSEKIGLVNYGSDRGEDHASEATRNLIDAEVRQLTDASYKRAKELLTTHSAQHHLLAKTMLEYETLTGDEVRDLIKKGKKPSRPVINKDGGARGNRDVLGNSNSGNRGSRLPGFGKDAQ